MMDDESRLLEIAMAFVAGLLAASPTEFTEPVALVVFFIYSLDGHGNKLTFVNDARFSEKGLEIYDTRFEQWRVFSEESREILIGEAVIVDD